MSKRTIKLFSLAFVIPIFLVLILIIVVYFSQDKIVQKFLGSINHTFQGEMVIDESHVAPFVNFPYISIDLKGVSFYENKNKDSKPLYEAKDIYLGFDALDIINGKFNIRYVKISNGHLDIVKNERGEINLMVAKNLYSQETTASGQDDFHIDLKQMIIDNFHIVFKDLETKRDLVANISELKTSFELAEGHILLDVLTDMVFDLDEDGEHTFFADKPMHLDIELDFDRQTKLLTIKPSKIKLVEAFFGIDGTVDLKDDFNFDLRFNGEKPDFGLFTAFAPNDVAQALSRYKNQGEIYFNGTVKGTADNESMPAFNVEFGCENAYFLNTKVNKKVDELRFSGTFSNGEERTMESMILTLQNFHAVPEEGIFQGTLVVKNFTDPHVKVNLNADVHLDFLGQFFNIEGLRRLKGQIILDMDFDELVDLNMPGNNLAKLKEGIDSEIIIKDLSFTIPGYDSPVTDANGHAIMRNGLITLDSLNFKVADSDFRMNGSLSDFPAVFHAENKPVRATLNMASEKINFKDLIPAKAGESKNKEVLSDFKIKLAFVTTADQLTGFKYLPQGEFFIEDFYGKFNSYAHTFHDFHTDIVITDKDFKLIDFSGEIDQTDLHFTGSLKNYPKWFQKVTVGDSRLEFDLVSNYIHPGDLLTYNGGLYVPEDYKNEEIRDLKMHGILNLHYDSVFKSADFYLQELDAKLNLHPLKLEDFKGQLHFENDQLRVQDFSGKMGKSDFLVQMDYYIGDSLSSQKRSNFLKLTSKAMDLDALMNYSSTETTGKSSQSTGKNSNKHAEAFNIFSIPFSNMRFTADIQQLNYHTYWLNDFKLEARSTQDHYLYIDNLSLAAANGNLELTGYFNGSDPDHIYFSSDLKANRLDIDKLLLKFENLGQDYLINENLQGKVSGSIKSKFLVYPDLTPIIDKSEAQFDLTIYEGSLINFAPLSAMSRYFKDKNLNLVRFDTLENQFILSNGVLKIPRMAINSSIGFMELSGTQDLNLNIDYYLRVPLNLVTKVGFRHLFGGKNIEEVDPAQEDAIVYADKNKNMRYVNINISGNNDDYEVRLKKEK